MHFTSFFINIYGIHICFNLKITCFFSRYILEITKNQKKEYKLFTKQDLLLYILNLNLPCFVFIQTYILLPSQMKLLDKSFINHEGLIEHIENIFSILYSLNISQNEAIYKSIMIQYII
jgi:hypothetical protein